MDSVAENTVVVDWKDCNLTEIIPGKVSGVPLLKGTRLPADTILQNYNGGSPVEEIADNFDVPRSSVLGILAYVANQRNRPRT